MTASSWGDPALLRNGVSLISFPMQLQRTEVYSSHQGSPPSLQYFDIISINWLFTWARIFKIYSGFSVPTHLRIGLSILIEKNNSDLFKVSYIDISIQMAKTKHGKKQESSPSELASSTTLRPHASAMQELSMRNWRVRTLGSCYLPTWIYFCFGFHAFW